MEKTLKKYFFIFPIIVIAVAVLVFHKNNSPQNQQKIATNTPGTKKETKIPSPTLDSIFAVSDENLTSLDQSKVVKLIATGDVIPARGANWPAVQSGNFHYNWEKTAAYLKTGDITLINLEAPLMKSCPLTSSGFTFCGDARHIQGILFAGVDVANITNNHIGNYGQAGITETENLLNANAVEWSGFSHLGIKEIKGIKFGFLGYNGVGVHIDRESMAKEIAEAKPKVDVLVISVHWGKEYESLPMTDGNIAPDNPREIGHIMIDSGADLVIGNHPHWVQGVEFYKGKLITFAHGNFIFDQTWSIETQEGVVGEYTFYGNTLVDIHYKPIVVDKSYQPTFTEGDRAAKIMKQMQDSSLTIEKTSP